MALTIATGALTRTRGGRGGEGGREEGKGREGRRWETGECFSPDFSFPSLLSVCE